MKQNILSLATIALFASLAIATKAATQVYDLKNQWSATANPNGTWTYRQGESLLINSPFSWVGTDYASVYAGCSPGHPCGFRYPPIVPVITKFTETFSVPYFSGGLYLFGGLELGDILVTPGNGGNVLWTAPESGTIKISGAFWSVDGSCVYPRDVFWTLAHDETLLSGGDIPNAGCDDSTVYTRSSPYDLSLGSGGAAALQNISVEAGDQLVLAFNKSIGIGIGVNLTITLTTGSLDPVGAVEALATTVIEMNLQNGIANSLDSKLDAALNVLLDVNVSNDGAACNSLQAFINSVQAQRNKKITNAQADQLIASAEEIKEMLHCGN